MVAPYNHTVNRTIGIPPAYNGVHESIWKKGTHNIPEIVLLSKAKRTFKKGYLPNWTEELFTVVKCIETRTPVYLVKDDHGEILEGQFDAEEIQKVIKQDDVYKIQSVLRKRRKGRRVQYLVKRFGYPESFNSWIFKQDLQKRRFAV
jgi:hypothetical protein